MNKFDNLTDENDTVILLSLDSTLEEFDVKYEAWLWDHTKAESFIFMESDLNSMNDEQLESLARHSPLIDPKSKIIIRRNVDGYAFVNFNFKEIDDCIDFEAVNSALGL